MSLIDDIRNDREAGTPGDWLIVDPSDDTDGSTYPAHINGGRRELEICQFLGDWRVSDLMVESHSDHRSKKANARRIARVPDMEAALLAAEELAQAVDFWTQAEEPDVSDAIYRLKRAAAAYRAATQ